MSLLTKSCKAPTQIIIALLDPHFYNTIYQSYLFVCLNLIITLSIMKEDQSGLCTF